MSYEVTPTSSLAAPQVSVAPRLPSARPVSFAGTVGGSSSFGGVAWVVTGTALLGSERLPALSLARTLKV